MWVILIGIVIVLIVLTCIIIPPGGEIKAFRDENGNICPNSIAEKTWVKIGGVDQGMIIKGRDMTKPVLLFLSGGPGIPEYFLEERYPTGLEEEFIVCYWHYRGTSLSYNPDIPEETMTTDQYLADAVEVTDYLRERFGQDKIYLMGHSFGTSIGVRLANQRPELYHAYIAISQMADQYESEKEAYCYMLEQYQAKGNRRMVEKFGKYNIEKSPEDLHKYCNSGLRDKAMHELGVGSTHDMDSVISGIVFPSLQMKGYTPAERINIWKGKIFSAKTKVCRDAFLFNAFEEVPEIGIPVYFFAGKYDYTCCYSIQKKYYEQLKAPLKKFYTFEDSAHSPLFEEPTKAMEIIRTQIISK